MKARGLLPAAFCVLLLLPSWVYATCLSEQQERSQTEKALSRLPPAKRKILTDTIIRVNKQNRKLLEEKHRLESELDAILASPEFDQRSYLDKSAKLGTLRAKMHANSEDAIAWIAARFTPQERKVLIGMRKLWKMHGDREEWLLNGEEESHQPPAQ
jgi:uncharacterized membrane protein